MASLAISRKTGKAKAWGRGPARGAGPAGPGLGKDMDTPIRQRDRSLIRGLLEALPAAILIIGEDDRVVAANAAALALLPSLRMDELLARGLRSPDVLDSVSRVRASGRSERVIWLEKVPVERSFEVSIAPFGGDGFEPLLILSLHDLTEARRLERMRVDFVANASHELRTPLASVLGFVETLQGPARDDAIARTKFLAIMREQAQRMSRLVDDLLSLSRIEQHLHVRPSTPVDLVGILRHIVDTLSPMADDRRVKLSIAAPNSPVVVAGDRDELLRVAENLIENAIKYGAADAATQNRTVDIAITVQGLQAVLSVRDYGAGIAHEHLPRLTERFYRVDAGESRAKGGTGLGLAIVKHIIARHRGRLTIESKLGEGANFSVFLPLFEARA
ncbi:Alkaline phosphatase synthesis sensor protein PhoR [Methylovirgula sp. HY1]|nr:Alkaline phosphatase synthesis sensor protein PhoR [Methylovirgula sp. HY1]